jgi:GGDEF domain-containing protein
MSNVLKELYNAISYDPKLLNPIYAFNESFKDNLTGCLNGNAFRKDIKNISKNNSSLAMYAIDVSSLSYLNNNYGHEYGNKLIKEEFSAVERVVHAHKNDVPKYNLYRDYGDDFILMLHDVSQERAKDVNIRLKNISEVHYTNGKFPKGFIFNIYVGFKFFENVKELSEKVCFEWMKECREIMNEEKKQFYIKHPELDGRSHIQDIQHIKTHII